MPSKVCQTLISRIISLVREHSPEGINLIDISRDYYKSFGTYLISNDFGFKSMYELCQQICKECQNSLVIRNRNESLLKSDRIFFDEKSYRLWIQKEQKRRNVSLLESLVHQLLPKDVVLHHKHNGLPSLRLPDKAFDLDYIRVLSAKLMHVVSPNEMYIHLSTNSDIYRDLRESLRYYDAYYGDENEKYLLPFELVAVGYYCVVRNPLDWFNWHRAVIIAHNEDTVTLFAIDFGNIITDSINELRLMKNMFFYIPPLAIKVSLAGIEPIHDQWSEESITFIKRFTAQYSTEYKMGCAFLYQLAEDYYEVVFGYQTEICIEGLTQKMLIYLHEKMITRNLALMKFNYSANFINNYPISRVEYSTDISHHQNEYQNKIKAIEYQICEVKSELFEEKVIKKEMDSNYHKNETHIKQEVNEEEAVVSYKGLYFTLEPIVSVKEKKYITEELTPLFKTYEGPKYFLISESLKNKAKPLKYFSLEMLTQFDKNEMKYFTGEKVFINKRQYFIQNTKIAESISI